MMMVTTVATFLNHYWALNYNWTFYDYRTLNHYRSFYDYWSVVMMAVMSWHVIGLNNHGVMMMSMVVVANFNTMMIVMVMMLCRN